MTKKQSSRTEFFSSLMFRFIRIYNCTPVGHQRVLYLYCNIVLVHVTKVFVSYSSIELNAASGVVQFLERNGVECWIASRDVSGGKPYASEIVTGISNCDKVVFIGSNNSNMSEHVLNEIDIAVRRNKEIIPFMIEDVELNDDILYYVGRKHMVFAYPEKVDLYYDKLLASVNNVNESSKKYAQKKSAQITRDINTMFNENFLTMEDLVKIESAQSFDGKKLIRLDIVTNTLSLADNMFSKIMHKNLKDGLKYVYYYIPSDSNLLVAAELKETFSSANIQFVEVDDKEWFFLVEDFFFTIYTLQETGSSKNVYAGVMSNATKVGGVSYNVLMSEKLITRIRSILLKYRV